MSRTRSLAGRAPALVVALVVLTTSLAGGAYATTRSSSQAHTGNATLVTWSPITLQNGWASSQSIYATGDPRASIQTGIVYLSGSLHQSTPTSSVFATLATTYRPAHNLYITVYTNGGTSGTLYIGHDGTMEAFSSATCGSGNAAQCFTSLASVSYPKNS
jgi:hypothetical protein